MLTPEQQEKIEKQIKRRKRKTEYWEKQEQAVTLYGRGLTYQAIADKLGYATASGAHYCIRLALSKRLKNSGGEKVKAMFISQIRDTLLRINVKLQKYEEQDRLTPDQFLGFMDRILKCIITEAQIEGLVKNTTQNFNNFGKGNQNVMINNLQQLIKMGEKIQSTITPIPAKLNGNNLNGNKQTNQEPDKDDNSTDKN